MVKPSLPHADAAPADRMRPGSGVPRSEVTASGITLINTAVGYVSGGLVVE